MLHSTHYAALGLDEHERAAAIHSAYRDLARRYHPARVGPGGDENFRSIADAYRVLSDSSLRHSYDDARARAEGTLTSRARPPSLSGAGPRPLGPNVAEPPIETMSLRRAALRASSVGEAILARFARNFSGVGVPKSESVHCLHVRAFVAPGHDHDGVVLRLDVPVLVRCVSCAGHHATALAQCHACNGSGFAESERTLTVLVMAAEGMTGEVSLVPLGIQNFYLHLAVHHDLFA